MIHRLARVTKKFKIMCEGNGIIHHPSLLEGGVSTNEDRWGEIKSYLARHLFYLPSVWQQDNILPIAVYCLSWLIFFYLQVEDLADDLDSRSLAFLQAGFTYLVVTSKLAGDKAKAVQLRAKVTKVCVYFRHE